MESTKFEQFIEIIRRLRDPEGGCPWDKEQDHLSLRPYLIEEAYEVIEAIESGSDGALRDELGDLLLQVVLHSQVAKDRSAFTIDDVIENVSSKMLRRHPHVFGDVNVKDSDEVLRNWEQIKAKEREIDSKNNSVSSSSKLAAVPSSLPALIQAQRIGEKAAKVGFDWTNKADVLLKVKEELAELEEAIDGSGDIEAELGDLLFSICQLSRWLRLGAEDSLRAAAKRFVSRFQEMEGIIPGDLSSFSELELEHAWQQAKRQLAMAKTEKNK